MTDLDSLKFESILSEAGVKPTVQRIAIARYVLQGGRHPNAEQIKEWSDKNNLKVSLATVYNTLNVLVESKLLREYKFPHEDKIFYCHNIKDHFHLWDQDSGKIVDIPKEEVEIRHQLANEYQIDGTEILFKARKRS